MKHKSINSEEQARLFQLAYHLAFESKKRKDWGYIFSVWYMAAQNGHPRAQFYVGVCYNHGQGVEKNLRLAYNWYLKGAR